MQAQHKGALTHRSRRESEIAVLKHHRFNRLFRTHHAGSGGCVSQVSAKHGILSIFWTDSMTTTIWHNPRCSKSRLTLALLQEHDIEATVRLYLEDAPSVAELNVVVSQLGIRPWDLLRRGENIFKGLGLNKGSSDKAVIEAMAKHPILIERPVVIHHDKAALGRPPENTLALFN